MQYLLRLISPKIEDIIIVLLTHMLNYMYENSIRDARTPQPGERVFNTMTYKSSEAVQRLG